MLEIQLQKVLDRKGMTQKDLSDRTGLTPTSVSRICNRPKAIRLDTLSLIVSALDISISDLIVRRTMQDVWAEQAAAQENGS